ncbi:MAG: efflux RND transporter periplasmic adaptor subunit [Sandaracinaceae bacterium]|nr:efflux RND transporter periplasmic adaptor subunit [Myxococcales bacterium]MCB9656109.1 efflux RND transporter periplasmic adaptor subunit [Sandaracinaceae bacterium]
MACGGPPSAETDASGDTRAAIRQDARQDAPTDVRAASALGSPREATPGDSGALPGAAHDPSDGSSPEGVAVPLREALGRVVTTSGVSDVGLVFDGRVRRLVAHVGDALEEGDVVAEVESPELALAAVEVVGLAAQSRLLSEQRERVAQLVAESLEPRATLDAAEVALVQLRTRADMAAATLRAADVRAADRRYLARHGVLRVRTPRAGVVVALLVREGASVGREMPLARVVSPSDAVVQVTTAQRAPDGPVTLVVDGHELPATPTQAPVLDPSTGMFHTFYPVTSPLPHGAWVTVRFGREQP